ncbi:MAG: AzlC family ABC transporter permease [Erysipelotrichaceae bacterium]|nr:AzlC family ABC transporter permease [Erysipelotrichaceae bacterium]
MKKGLFSQLLVKTLPVMAGYLVLGTGFGILMNVNGFGLWAVLAMSVLVYAGSMQFAGISLITSGASLLSIALTTLMVNARHLFYGISMIEKYRGAGICKPYLMHSLTDETYSLVVSEKVPEGISPFKYFTLISLFNHAYWVIGSMLGFLIGSMLPFDPAGIDFAMTALFVTVFTEQWLSVREHRPALTGLGASAFCLMVFGADQFLIPAMALITALLLLSKKKLEGKMDRE